MVESSVSSAPKVDIFVPITVSYDLLVLWYWTLAGFCLNTLVWVFMEPSNIRCRVLVGLSPTLGTRLLSVVDPLPDIMACLPEGVKANVSPRHHGWSVIGPSIRWDLRNLIHLISRFGGILQAGS